jgi:hypothetical protein
MGARSSYTTRHVIRELGAVGRSLVWFFGGSCVILVASTLAVAMLPEAWRIRLSQGGDFAAGLGVGIAFLAGAAALIFAAYVQSERGDQALGAWVSLMELGRSLEGFVAAGDSALKADMPDLSPLGPAERRQEIDRMIRTIRIRDHDDLLLQLRRLQKACDVCLASPFLLPALSVSIMIPNPEVRTQEVAATLSDCLIRLSLQVSEMVEDGTNHVGYNIIDVPGSPNMLLMLAESISQVSVDDIRLAWLDEVNQ